MARKQPGEADASDAALRREVRQAAEPGKSDRQFITALARGLDVLRAFHVDDEPLSNQELARRTGLPRPTISRIAHTLTDLGYLNYRAGYGLYELGGAALVLGNVARANFTLIRDIQPIMVAVALESGANVGFGARDRASMIYLETCQGPSRIGLRLDVGARIPISSTAMGRAYLAAAEGDELKMILTQLRRKYSIDQVAEILGLARSELRQHGFCISAGAWHSDIHGIAVPVKAPGLGGLYALNCGGPAYLLPHKMLVNDIGPALVRAAQEIAALFAPQADAGEPCKAIT